MLETPVASIEERAKAWIDAFDAVVADRSETELADLFEDDSYWRNLSGISWPIRTFSGSRAIAGALCSRAAEAGVAGFLLDAETFKPRINVVAGREVIEAAFRFDGRNGPGQGVVRIPTNTAKSPKAWTLSTGLDIDAICRSRFANSGSESYRRDFSEPSWPARRQAEIAYSDRDPEILVVGGGHAGLTAAVELKRLGHDVLVIDREKRVGDNWRLRYDGLKLHNRTPINHLRYMPFPVTAPDYLPKDKVANWLESYVDSMDVNFWTGTTFESAAYDEATGRWSAKISRLEGPARQFHPKHIVVATSVSGTPNLPAMPTVENFRGLVQHSSQFESGSRWRDKSVVVFGTGTSAHDIAQELHDHGARVTMVQRGSTLVVNIDPSAQLYDGVYLGDGPAIEVRDLLNSSIPYPVARAAHKIITRKVKELDAPLLDRLEKVGFKLDFGEDETGWPLKFRNRGGGYYLNIGCSDLIAEGAIRLLQADAIRQFTEHGLELADGSALQADLVVLATGYKGQDYIVRQAFGEEVAKRVGTIWGLDPDYHELRNMWTRTGQPGLWFTGGAFSMCRIYSRLMALQIDAIERGELKK